MWVALGFLVTAFAAVVVRGARRGAAWGRLFGVAIVVALACTLPFLGPLIEFGVAPPMSGGGPSGPPNLGRRDMSEASGKRRG